MKKLAFCLFLLGWTLVHSQQPPSAMDYFNQLNNDQNTVSRWCWKYLMEAATSNNLRKCESIRQQLLGATRRAQTKLQSLAKGFDNDTQLQIAFGQYYQQVLDGFERDCGQWLSMQKGIEPDFTTWKIQMEGLSKLRTTTAKSWTQLNAAKVDFAENHNMQLHRPDWLRAEKLDQVRDAILYAQEAYGWMYETLTTASPWTKLTEQPDPNAVQLLLDQLKAVLSRTEPHLKALPAFHNDNQLQWAAQEALGSYQQLSNQFLPQYHAFLIQKKQLEARQQQLDVLPPSTDKNQQIKAFNQQASALQTALQQQNALLKTTLEIWNASQKRWRETYYSFITSHIPQD